MMLFSVPARNILNSKTLFPSISLLLNGRQTEAGKEY